MTVSRAAQNRASKDEFGICIAVANAKRAFSRAERCILSLRESAVVVPVISKTVKPKLHLVRQSRHVSTRHVRRVEPRHFGCVELVEQHSSTRSTRRARLGRHVERVVSCRDVKRGVKWNLGFTEQSLLLTAEQQ